MGVVQDITDLVARLGFLKQINEYELGLYFRNGKVIPRPTHLTPEAKEQEVSDLEHKTTEAMGGLWKCITRQTPVPDGYVRSTILGKPIHRDRIKKNMGYGTYFHWPVYDKIVTDYKQERVLNLARIGLPTSSGNPTHVVVSVNVRYELRDFYKAYTEVHDYEKSITSHALSALSRCVRDKPAEYWRTAGVINTLEDDAAKELRKVASQRWGLDILEVSVTELYLTDKIDGHIQIMISDTSQPAQQIPVLQTNTGST
jgi:hypothetical protein